MAYKRLIAIDFDGVLHSYTTRWTDAATISDPPTPGAMKFLQALVEDGRFEVVVVSSRCATAQGRRTVMAWIDRQLIEAFGDEKAAEIFRAMRAVAERPPAHVTLDDRGWTFDGTWPDLDAIAAFVPWNKRPQALPLRVDYAQAAPETLPVVVGVDVQPGPDGVPRTWIGDAGYLLVADEAGDGWDGGGGGKVDLVRTRQATFAAGEAEVDDLIARTERAQALRSLLETAWSLGAATAYARRDRAADYEADGKSDDEIRAADVGRVLATAEVAR